MADIETINDMKDGEKLDAIEDRAAMIASQIASATDPSILRSLGADAKALMAMIPQGNSRSGTVSSRVASVITEATNKEASESDIDEASPSLAGGPRSRMSMAFQQAIYNQFMSPEEKAYYDKFQAGTQYKMSSIDENGNITEKMVDGKQEKVDGTQLKEDFARVKSYTLTEEQQANLKLPDSEKKMGSLTPTEEINELKKLEKSLDNLEGQKAQELAEMGADKEEAKRVRGKFEGARMRIREVKDGLDDVEKARGNGLKSAEEYAMGDVKLKRRRLREALQEDVIDDALTDKKRGGRMGRDKDDLENEMVTPANTRAGSVRAKDSASKEDADKEILAANDDGETQRKNPMITGMQNLADGTAVSPAAAGQKQQSAREI